MQHHSYFTDGKTEAHRHLPIQDRTGNLWQDQHRLLITGVCLWRGLEGTTELACAQDPWQSWSWRVHKWKVWVSFPSATKIQLERKYKDNETFLIFFFLIFDSFLLLPPQKSVFHQWCYTLLFPYICTVSNLEGLMRRKAEEHWSLRLMLSP